MRRMMLLMVAAGVVAVVVAVGCGGGGSDSSAGSTAPSATTEASTAPSETASTPPPPASAETIIYVEGDSANGTVFRIDADGSHRWQLLENGTTPAWSPDGREIAVTFDYQEVAIISANGGSGTMRYVGGGSTFDSEPAWSPDGRRIACLGYDGGELTESGAFSMAEAYTVLYEFDTRTGRSSPLWVDVAGEFGVSPSWSPDGTRIAFASNGIKVVELKSGRVHALAPGTGPEWSPDGSRIAYSTGKAIAVMDADGSQRHTIVASKNGVEQPSWSPDGTRIVYGETSGGLRIVGADGSNPRRLTDTGFDPDWHP